jgi:hypothetical protein
MNELDLVPIDNNGNLWEGENYSRRWGTLLVLESTYEQRRDLQGERKWNGDTYTCVRKFRDRVWYDNTFNRLFEYVICQHTDTRRETEIDKLAITNMIEMILDIEKD